MTRFMVTVGGTVIVSAGSMEEAAELGATNLAALTKWQVDVTDIDVGNRKKVEVNNPSPPDGTL